jgi:hypothetical protein
MFVHFFVAKFQVLTSLRLQSVTQSNFANPCEKKTTPTQRIDSGFLAVLSDEVDLGLEPKFTITLSDVAPQWFFCAQTKYVILNTRRILS